MLKQRILTALVLLPLMLIMLFCASANVWGVFMGIITLLALWEFGRIGKLNHAQQKTYLSATAFFMLTALAGDWQLPAFVWLLVLGFWLAVMPMWLHRKWRLYGDTRTLMVGWLLMLPFWFAMMALRPEDESVAPLLSVMVLVWVADSAAYFIGKTFGKRRLAPQISPKKSWEGAIGGWLVVLIYMTWVQGNGWLGADLSWFGMMWVATILTAVSIGGDLLESLLKRAANVKDSSQLLPGHGGVFDRIDSLIAVLAVYAAVQVLCA